jgi:signal transduction histidine kinase
MKSLYRPFQIYGLIVVLYIALVSWWVYFFTHARDFLVQHLVDEGAQLSAEQIAALETVSSRMGRMFLAESAFIGLLMIGSVWLVLRSLRHEMRLAQQQKNFLSAVTHELRSPNASAKLYIESIQMGRAGPDKTQRYLRHAHQDLRRLAGLVEDLLEGRRIAERGVQVFPERVDLSKVVSKHVLHLSTLYDSQGARLELVAPEPVRAPVDTGAIERIVDNLVSNGIKYGGQEPQVRVSVRQEQGQAVLEVRDYGQGLKGADTRRIFEPFVRGGDESVRTQVGVGMGLYIVRELVWAHHGQVQVKDGLEGGGTLFRVTLPLDTAPDPAAVANGGTR